MEDGLKERFQNLSASGYRTLGVAYKSTTGIDQMKSKKGHDLCWNDHFPRSLKPHIGETAGTTQLGVQLKVITGDNRYVADIAKVELSTDEVLTGDELTKMNEMASNGKWRILPYLRKSTPTKRADHLEPAQGG